MIYSPLRYPGGKNKLAPFLAKICIDNGITEHYIEPYCGGASVALFLLFEGFVQKITINDKDRSIYAFWHSVLNSPEALCRLINDTSITVNEWRKQKDVQREKQNADLLELGFSTFFLNRTNRSGIINAGMIGGYNQSGRYRIDCRFNKKNLIERIHRISNQREKISLYNKDALAIVENLDLNKDLHKTLLYFDPPYFEKGGSLYMNYYQKSHHEDVCKVIKSLQYVNWVVSYDNVPEINKLYLDCAKIDYSLTHTAAKSKIGQESLFFSSNIVFETDKNPLGYKLEKYNNQRAVVYNWNIK